MIYRDLRQTIWLIQKNSYICRPKMCQAQVGLVAQLVEQRTENPCVGGSIPPQTTKAPVFGAFSFYILFLFMFSRSK